MLSRRTPSLVAALSIVIPLLSTTTCANAQSTYPSHPIRLVIGFTAGGISDVIARAIAAKLTQSLGQTVFVDNRPGAGTTTAADIVAHAAPDGYTLMLQDVTTQAVNATLYTKLPYDTVKSFTPISVVASTPLMLVVPPSSPAKNVQELIAMLRAKPTAYSYGSSGNGTIVHLTTELFKQATKTEATHVPYKGSAPATQAILAGEVAFVFSSMPPAIAASNAGTLRALAVTTAKRVNTAPQVPTMIEAGVPNFEIVLYSGIMGPAGIPPDIVNKLNGELKKVLASDDIKTVYRNVGADVLTTTPQEFAALLDREIDQLGPIVKASGAKVE